MKSGQPYKVLLATIAFFLTFASTVAAGVIYVDATASGNNNGSSWADAYNCLQDALTAAAAGDEIWVADGTYKPDRDTTHPYGTGDRTATFQLKSGVGVYGGFHGPLPGPPGQPPTGGETSRDQRDPNANMTVLNGDLAGNDAGGVGDPSRSDNSFHIVTGSGTDETAVLDGFTITAGNADGPYPHNRGAGVLNSSGNPSVANCTFIVNSAEGNGGGIYNANSRPTLTDCIFVENVAGGNGGGIYNQASSIAVTRCNFSDNSAEQGSAIFNHNSTLTLTDCMFTRNSVHLDGTIFSADLDTQFHGDISLTEQWASYATASSEYTATSWSAMQATGEPDTSSCGDISTAWAPSSSGSEPEWLELYYDTPVYATGLGVHETYNSGCIYQVDFIDTNDTYRTIWTGSDSTPCPGWFTLEFDHTEYKVRGIKIYTQIASWEEIDAVKLVGSPLISTPPVACIVGGNQILEAEAPWGATVTLDGSCSTDVDSTPGTNDDISDFNWYLADPCDPDFADLLGSGEIIDCNLPLGHHTVLLEVIDRAGQSDTTQVGIIVQDTTPPVISCPEVISVSGFGPTPVSFTVTATDKADPNPEVMTDIPSGSLFEHGLTTVMATATDASGNSSVCRFNVLVSCFAVNNLRLAKKGNDVDIKGTFDPAVPIDLAVHEVTYFIDDGHGSGLTFSIPAGSFEVDGKPEHGKFKFDSPKGSQPDIKAKFDFLKCTFELDVKKIPNPNEFTSDSLTFGLQAANNIGEEIVPVEDKSKHLEHKKKPKLYCCPQ